MADKPDLYLAASISSELRAELDNRFIVHDKPLPSTRAFVGTGMTVLTRSEIEAMPALEIVAIHGVGHDGLDLAALKERGIAVTTTPDVLNEDVADLAIALMLAVHRRIPANDRLVREGGWKAPPGHRLSGRRIGIFGLGRIGQAIAERAAPFGGEILYTARSAKEVPWRFVPDIVALARACDVLVLIAPGGAETDRIVNAEVLDALGPQGVLINVARGSLVDEPALIAALEAGTIAGAGLDVFADEPHVPEALRQMEQVVLVPHQGSATEETRRAMAALVLANLAAHFAGRPLPTPLS